MRYAELGQAQSSPQRIGFACGRIRSVCRPVADSKPELPLVATKLRRAIRDGVRFFLVLMLGTQVFAGGLDPYARLIVADSFGGKLAVLDTASGEVEAIAVWYAQQH